MDLLDKALTEQFNNAVKEEVEHAIVQTKIEAIKKLRTIHEMLPGLSFGMYLMIDLNIPGDIFACDSFFGEQLDIAIERIIKKEYLDWFGPNITDDDIEQLKIVWASKVLGGK